MADRESRQHQGHHAVAWQGHQMVKPRDGEGDEPDAQKKDSREIGRHFGDTKQTANVNDSHSRYVRKASHSDYGKSSTSPIASESRHA